MRGVTYSKLVFLDSQDGVRGAKALRPTFTVPSNDFSVGNDIPVAPQQPMYSADYLRVFGSPY